MVEITIISYAHKKQRFEDAHLKAVRFPVSSTEYIGVPSLATLPAHFLDFELNTTIPQFRKDMYGCHTKLLKKKLGRNLWRNWWSYGPLCPEMKGLLEFCPGIEVDGSVVGGGAIYGGHLPWGNL